MRPMRRVAWTEVAVYKPLPDGTGAISGPAGLPMKGGSWLLALGKSGLVPTKS
jgi:hypothetical protein